MIPLYTIEQARLFDQIAIKGYNIPSICLMENAARTVFDVINKYLEGNLNPTISILAGKGNNAGDGFAVARMLLSKNYKVHVFLVFPKDEIKGDALINYEILEKISVENKNLIIKNIDSHECLKTLKSSSVILDAIFGTGIKGDLPQKVSNLIEYVNTLDNTKIAIDLPTGLTNNSTGKVVFNANCTISLGILKRNLFYARGYENSGKVIQGFLGTPNNIIYKLFTDTYLLEKSDVKKFLPVKNKIVNKYSQGKLLIISGSKDFFGAPQIVANSALYSGAGAVYLAFPEKYRNNLTSVIEPVVIGYNSKNGHFDTDALTEINELVEKSSVIAIGPGISKNHDTIEATYHLFSKYMDKIFVVDADAFPALKILLNNQVKLNNFVITPHYGEFANLLGITTDELQENLLDIATRFVNKTKCYLVLKGAPTIVFTPDNKIYINSTGNEGMAKFGTGDALTGIIASFILQSKIVEAGILSAVYVHSLAADLLSQNNTVYSVTASDIIKYYPVAIKEIIS